MKAPPVIGGRSVGLLVAAGLSIVAMVVLFYFNPAQHGFYPRCFLKMSTGLDCAGCGGLRATHQLLHGNIRAAFHFNPLMFFAAPVLGLVIANVVAEALGRNKVVSSSLMRILLWTLLTTMILFTVWRNLPRA